MALFNKEQENVAEVLLENDAAILAELVQLKEKVDAIERNNKKFLLSATMGKTELLEKENVKLKMGIISLLDQIDLLMSTIISSDADHLKNGLKAYYKNVQGITDGLGLQQVHFGVGEPFNPKEQECIEQVHLEGYEDEMVTALHKRGYVDKNSGNLLRCAQVSVNRKDV